MSANYYSQTPNFVSASSEDVDPRTRLFSFQHSLGQLIGNNSMGPELTFGISYSATSATDYFNLGIGIALALTILDTVNGQLTLDSGESYKVDTTVNPPIIQQNKMRTFELIQVSNPDGSSIYRLTEHDGTVTDLTEYDAGIYVPTRMYTALGYSLIIDWEFTSWGWGIDNIKDDSGITLLKFDHNAGPTLIFYPGSEEEYSIYIGKSNGYLASISHSALPEGRWQYFYDDVGIGNGLLTLVQTKAITGLTKTVTYNNGTTNGLMLFPTESGEGALPAVTELIVDPGFNQPQMITTYTPDTPQGFLNYLGYDAPQGGQWDVSTDYVLTLAGQNYNYSTTLTRMDSDGQEISTTYTYNNYHLLSKMEVLQGDTYYSAETYYYADAWQEDNPNTTYDELPAQYQYPLRQTLSWQDSSGSRTELTQYQYDDFGNLTQQIDPDGTQTEFEFYSADGEADSADGYTGCPADPHGFVGLMKSKTVTPAPSDYDDIPVRVTYYRYGSLAALSDRPMTTAMIKVKESLVKLTDGSKQPLTIVDTKYYTDSASQDYYGHVHIKDTKIFHVDATNYSTSQTHTYTLQDNILQSDISIKTYDDFEINSSMKRSCYSGHLVSLTDFLGTIHNYYYDSTGRFSRMVKNEGDNDYQMTSYVDYTMSSDDNNPFLSTTLTDYNGSITRISHDALGRVITIEKNATEQINEEFFTVLTRNYDSLGRILYEAISDSYVDDSGSVQACTINVKKQYDDWGKSCAHNLFYVDDDNSESIYQTLVLQYMHVDNEINRYVNAGNDDVALNSKVIINNMALPGTVIQYDADGNEYSNTHSYYDGLKRLRQYVDEMGNATIYEYDDFDRVYQTTYADGTIVNKEYAPHFTLEIPQKITVIDKDGISYEVGKREIDGLGRVRNLTVGGRHDVYTYIDSDPEPNTFTDSLNRVFNYTYDPRLQYAPTNVTASYNGQNTEQTYTYFKNRGLLDTVTETGQQVNSYTWFKSGQVNTETVSNTLGSKTPTYTWSVMGKSVSYTDITGTVQWLNYNMSGENVAKPHTFTDPAVTLSFDYDDFGRLDTQTAEMVNGSATLETKITYDDYGREHVRTITPDSGEAIVITTQYFKNNQVSNVKIEQGTVTLSDNQYYYDLRNRLQKHDCSGSRLPKDGYGQEFTSQVFEYDCLNNIRTCTTVSSTGTTNIATFIYGNNSDPTQLTSIEHQGNAAYPPVINLAYYDDGRLQYDEAGRLLTYDASGRLLSIETNDSAKSGYSYDGLNNLVFQSVNSQEQYLYYRGSQLINQVRQSDQQQDRIITGLSGTAAVSHEQL